MPVQPRDLLCKLRKIHVCPANTGIFFRRKPLEGDPDTVQPGLDQRLGPFWREQSAVRHELDSPADLHFLGVSHHFRQLRVQEGFPLPGQGQGL